MSEATWRALAHARVVLSCESVFARLEMRSRLGAIADVVPRQLATVALAELEPHGDIGADLAGVRGAGRERRLDEVTAAIAERIRTGIDEVQWPVPDEGYDVVLTVDVAAAVYGFVAGCVKPLESLVVQHAHGRHDERSAHRLLSPRPFFDADAFTALAGLLNLVAAAEAAVHEAQRDHEAAVRDAAPDEHDG
ncbi:hypothetical protein ABIB37_000368 [Agrococcus sp. UYP10]|uniref:hypothetical protein n=1 Tax=Agrococcus sp. UYP10 TaxID=1756355 RepID=UPI0033923F59